MKYLIDTHLLIWTALNSAKLSTKARSILSQDDATYFFSAASIWEIAIKRSKNPALLPFDAASARKLFIATGFSELGITAEHCAAVESLPAIHADPFDRLLIAQAKTDGCILVTHDRFVTSYGDFTIMV